MNGNYWEILEQRRVNLGVSYPALSERSGVSVSELKRVFSGKQSNPTLKTIQAIAQVLGVELRINGSINVVPERTAEEIRETVAKEKAERLVKLVQGTSALEAQAVGPNAVRDMVARTVHELLTGPDRKLWAA